MKKILWLILFLLTLFVAIVLFNQEEIMHPQKRELQSYHLDWLNHPEKHGMKIEKHYSVDHTPYLIVSLLPYHAKSKRQLVLEKQLRGEVFEKHRGTLVLLHGKNGRKEDLLPVAERYVSLGFTCILPDLPSHGESRLKSLYYGTVKREQHYVDEVLDDASAYVNSENNLAIWGMSLGGAFAIQTVAHSKYDFKKMVLVSTFARLDKVLKDKSFSLFGQVLGDVLYDALAKSLAFFYHFKPIDANSAKVAKAIAVPLYQVHGEKDELISIEEAEALFEAFASKEKHLVRDEDGTHHNILITKQQFFKESGLFLLQK